MAIVASDIVYRLSVAAANGDTTAGTPATSLGDQVSTTAITTATLNNLFDDVTGAEAAAGSTEYRCIFVLNNTAGGLTLQNATISVLSETGTGSTVTIATDNIGITAKGLAGSPQAATIASETTAPTGVSAFGSGPLTIGNLAPGQVIGIWLKRVVTAGMAAVTPDSVVLRVTGDTLP
jgi:hypothetical protein